MKRYFTVCILHDAFTFFNTYFRDVTMIAGGRSIRTAAFLPAEFYPRGIQADLRIISDTVHNAEAGIKDKRLFLANHETHVYAELALACFSGKKMPAVIGNAASAWYNNRRAVIILLI